MIGPRRRAREIALSVLHAMDVSPEMPVEVALARTFEHFFGTATGERSAIDEDDGFGSNEPSANVRPDRALVEELVRGVGARREELDATLTRLSRNWRIERMAVVERNIIRLALWELLHAPSVPINVVINEAIELAKRFGTAEGAAFVNGILDRAVTELEIRR
jgi:N utilization substance protein B